MKLVFEPGKRRCGFILLFACAILILTILWPASMQAQGNTAAASFKLKAQAKSLYLVIGKEADVPKVNAVYKDGRIEDVTGSITWQSSSDVLTIVGGKVSGRYGASAKLKGTYGNQTVTVPVRIQEDFVEYGVEPSSVTLSVGSSKPIKVMGYYSSGKKVSIANKIQWKSGNEQVARVSGATIKGVAEGSATVTGVFGEQKFEVPVQITPKIKKLTVTPAKLVLTPGKSAAYSVQAIYEGGRKVDVSSQVTAKVSGTGIQVSNGTVTAAGQSKGSASVKLYYGGKGVSLPVSLQESLTGIEVQPTSLVIGAGASKPIKVIGTYSNGKKVSLASKVTWTSGNGKIAKVTGANVKGLTEGTTKIVGVYGDRTFEIPVQVTPKLQKLTVTSSSSKLAPYQTTTYRVQAVSSSGNSTDVTSLAQAKSNGKATANQGTITAVSKGKAVITFTYGGKKASLRITIE
ncbi:Ig-like domain-containing protein [Paenibacillus sp. MER TA 81-3]|uniref:Ig-like domain-containing protein n=1 Tax=Paenibacillus sp. MER TA 81-3 TaxID=2939573 RepID=UPI00203E69EE|nr:Ig-like domain-containing protein [Paenibacillus sp. MER TA 81-3]MCM3342633.1 Ig-like domain-containing protein [Paenibacillus sp. MER TA 81-3]